MITKNNFSLFIFNSIESSFKMKKIIDIYTILDYDACVHLYKFTLRLLNIVVHNTKMNIFSG